MRQGGMSTGVRLHYAHPKVLCQLRAHKFRSIFCPETFVAWIILLASEISNHYMYRLTSHRRHSVNHFSVLGWESQPPWIETRRKVETRMELAANRHSTLLHFSDILGTPLRKCDSWKAKCCGKLRWETLRWKPRAGLRTQKDACVLA